MAETKLAQEQKKKGGFKHQLWIFVKFSLVSVLVNFIQIGLQYLLPLIFDNVTATLPGWLSWIFNGESLFDRSNADGAADYAKYVVNGIVTWGYVLPFFLSNYVANCIGYVENKKRTFKSSAPRSHFAAYFVILTLVIIFATWLQGLVYGACTHADSATLHNLARLLCVAVAGAFQFVVLFFVQKWLLPEDPELVKKGEEERAKAEAEFEARQAAKAAKKAASKQDD